MDAIQMTIDDLMQSKRHEFEQKYPIYRLPKATLREEGWVDDWHYAELENPEEDDVYYGITLWGSDGNTYNYGYIAWVSNKGWYVWDSWKKTWKKNTLRNVLAWVQIPSLYRREDKGLHERLGLKGII